ncbi:efflux transporter outer membrane subunit [Xanthocytophaga flava]|uniref:efflux transporter outer membrane subunit n=1 Tax=Xanthocytophaga flava TaxID=3048013 RepID=UPI0028D49900|nr:efflux transporter outer membrane subunit [Xanthocytophaga flavus]MDJ1471785.1 efflux transporter outer membrane subunit [Xanthocytophaga flavus]
MKNKYKRTSQSLLYVVGLWLLLWVAGCKAGKDYQRPSIALPAQFHTVAATDSSIIDISWNQLFPDPVLRQWIDKALTQNYDMQLAIKRVETAEAYVKQSRVALLPAVNAQVAASSTTPSKNSLNGLSLENFLGRNHLEDYTAQLTLSWELDIWGKIRRQNEAVRATYLQSAEASRAVKTRLIANVSQNYFNLLMLEQQLEVARQNKLLSDTIVQMMQLQKTAGEVTELAVQQTQSQAQSAALLVSQLEQEITIQENALHILAGELPGTPIAHSRLNDFQLWTDVKTGIPAQVISKRPDVRASEMELVAANARVGAAQANRYPTLNITAAGGVNAFQASEWFVVPGSLFGTVAGGIAQPVFQRRALKTQLEVARIQSQESELRFRQTVLNAVGEVSNALVRIEKLQEQQQIASNRVEIQRGAIQNAQALFKSGIANYLEVITAQSNGLQARLDQASIKRQQLDAMVELYRSLGGG